MPGRRLGRRGVVAVTTLGVVATGMTMAAAEVTTPNATSLKAVGPVGAHGFPVWYEDDKALRLEQCLDVADEYCDPAFLTGEGLDPAQPLHIAASAAQSNFPGESFYYQAGNDFDLPGGGSMVFVSALEATFANEEAVNGDQVVFGRLRIRVDGLQAGGKYTVTHPYGADTFVADAEGEINFTEDKTPAPDNFGLALGSRIAPFLVDADGLHETPNGTYVGNPGEETTITGSAHGTNYVEITGPGIAAGTARDDTFVVLGKVSTNSGVEGIAAYRIDNPEGAQDYLDVYATAGEGDAVQVSGRGVPLTTLAGTGQNYYARIPVTANTFPADVTITNASDKPVASKSIPVTANVVVTGATYDAGTLTVTAESSDSGATLSADVGGMALTFAGGTATVTGMAAPPATITVKSSSGGEDRAPVLVTNATAGEVVPQVGIIAGLPAAAGMGAVFELNASSSTNAESFAWSASAGTVTPATGAVATFTAPSQPGQVTVTLTTTGPEGTKDTAQTINILAASELTTVDAVASTEAPAPGSSVTLTATGTNATSYLWKQTAGPAITVANLASAAITFTAPSQPVTFQVTATGPNSTATDTVTVTPGEQLVITSAELRTRDREWRISGTSSDTTLNTVEVFLSTTTGTQGSRIGTATVDATGAWTLRVRNGVTPGTGFTQLVAESSNDTLSPSFAYTSRR